MWEGGFEPPKALSHRILSPAHLTTLEPPHTIFSNIPFKKSSIIAKFDSQNPYIT